jgi:SNF2 family DNA or RNA helicase
VRTYGSVSLSPDRTQWVIGRAEPHVSIRLKQLFPSIPKAAVPPYRLPHNLITDTDLEWFLHRYPMDISDADKQSLAHGRDSFLQRQAEMERILMPDYAPAADAGLREGQELRLYQWQAIEVLRRRGSLLLGDEGGLGKTYTAAGFMVAEPSALPAAVVCDAHMQRQWREKIEAFTHLRIHLIKKVSPYDLPPADVYVYRISQVAGWADIFATGFFKSVTYDEPQSLRTGAGTAKGAACKVLSANTTYHLGLTATPIYNYGDEMWHVMQFIDDAALGQWPEFEREWCTAVGNGKYRIKDPKALGTYLREQYVMLRRLKQDVGQQLPKVSRVVEHIDYDAKAVAAVEDLARALAIQPCIRAAKAPARRRRPKHAS